MIDSRKIEFPGSTGRNLAARLDLPAKPRAFALFAHCFTCNKDIFAAPRIAQELTARGIAVLRFDFTGLGNSEGEFANTNFSSNVQDLVAAADYLAKEPCRAGTPDRPQPGRRGGARGSAARAGGDGCRHHRRAVFGRPCHA